MKDTILIIGAPRSGTTLLSGLLTGNEECFPNIPECTFLTQIIEHYFNIINYSDKERFRLYANDENTLKEAYRQHIVNMLSIVLSHFENKDYKHLVLKDPELTKYIDLIPDFFTSHNKIVFIVRDPRAIISSMLKVELIKEDNINSSKLIFFNNLYKNKLIKEIAENIFNYFYIAHQSNVNKNNKLCIIKYEEIINEKESEFLKLEKFVDYKISRKPFERNYFNFDEKDPTYSKNYGKGVIKVKSDFNDVLPKKSIKMIETMFSKFNENYKWW